MDEFTTEVLAMMRVRIINQRSLETYVYNYVGGEEGGGAKRRNRFNRLFAITLVRVYEETEVQKTRKLWR